MAQRTFVKFHMDVGIGDVVIDPLERIQTRDWFAFAEIPPPSVPMIPREQQFAEKLHAYTLPRAGTVNSRVRDLIDMVLLIQSGTLDVSVAAEALSRTFDRRGTHLIPATLEPPPPDWNTPFERFADECHLDQPAPTLQPNQSGSSGGNSENPHRFQHGAKPDAGQGR
jgi:hypothetical protein